MREETLKEHVLFEGRIIRVRCDEVLLPDGTTSTREVVDHPGGACVLCVHGGKVVLVKQFRYAYREELYEIPAGKLERGEDPMLAAKRELEEETGLVADRLVHLFTMYPTPGYCNEKIYIYRADGVSAGKKHLDEGEFLDVAEIPLEEAYAMIGDGRIRDAKTVIALQQYRIDRA